MTKAQLEERLQYIEQELRELKAILDTDSEEYAEMLNAKSKRNHTYTHSDTYPFRVGVASATIKYILESI